MQKMLSVLEGKNLTPPPIWLMRQAGRYLPEYREIRAQAGDFLSLCFNPEWASEVTLQPIRRYDLDAAIIFSDILVTPYALGQEVRFVAGEGPKLGELNIDKLHYKPELLDPVYEALSRTRTALPEDKTLIGFCGAPWTVACYMVEGGSSKDWQKARLMAQTNREAFAALIDQLVEISAHYLCSQIEAGANCVQIFDSWSGALSESEFEKWVIEPTRNIIKSVRAKYPETPIIGFPKGAGAKAQRYVKETGVNAIGLDTSVPLDQAQDLQRFCPVQGNLDPIALLTGGTHLTLEVNRILDSLSDGPMIFNLGHGVIKETSPENVAQVVEMVRNYKR